MPVKAIKLSFEERPLRRLPLKAASLTYAELEGHARACFPSIKVSDGYSFSPSISSLFIVLPPDTPRDSYASP